MIDRAHLEAERALNLLRLAARVDPILRQAVQDVERFIDAERDRADGYRKALGDLTDGEKWWDYLSEGFTEERIKEIFTLLGKSTADPLSMRRAAALEETR